MSSSESSSSSKHYFIKSGNKFGISPKENLDIYEKLPAATYTIGQGCEGQFFLQTIDSFQVSGKVYGETPRQAERILRTFQDRAAASTGVLLAGEKGSGKTLLAKYISIQALAQGIPTIVINKNWTGELFNTFLQSIEQPAIILFDEYEKVYACHQDQEKMLTLLDGVYPSKKLFLLTCNDKWQVNSNMRNRPGRIFYLLNFSGISQEFIQEYCQDNLNETHHIPNICAIATLFCAFNFDMLKALVEEMNRYNESPSEALKFLNTRPEFNNSKAYSVRLKVDGKLKTEKNGVGSQWHGNPMMNRIEMRYHEIFAVPAGQDEINGRVRRRHEAKKVEFTAADLEMLDASTGRFVFATANARLVLTEVKTGFTVDFDKIQSGSSAVKGVWKPAMIDVEVDTDTDEEETTSSQGGGEN